MTGRLRRREYVARRDLNLWEVLYLRTGLVAGSVGGLQFAWRDEHGVVHVDDRAAEVAWRDHVDQVEEVIPDGFASWAARRWAGAREPLHERYGHLRANMGGAS